MTSELAHLLKDLAIAVDPVRFAESLGFTLDAWQADLIRSDNKRILLLAARQVGKSAICSILALHHALNKPEALVLVLSPSLRQSSELFKRIIRFYRESGRPIPSQTETALTLKLHNGARIVSLPSKEQTVRGFSDVSLLLIDEAALVDDDLYRAVRPMLAVSEGTLIAMGTPHGKRGFFYTEFTSRDEAAWKRYTIKADECPRISKEFLDEERRALGDYWYAQEYECAWHENESALFRADVIRRAVRDMPELDLDLDLGRSALEPTYHDEGEYDLNLEEGDK